MSMSVAGAKPGRAALTLAALGVVYGDIGTSPIYTVGLLFGEGSEFAPTQADVCGFLSLVIWALVVVVTLKYVFTILRADNNGEGGVLALLALALRGEGEGRRRRVLLTAGILGVAMFFADGIITPAISVLSAVEGLEIAAPGLHAYIVPIAIGILAGLFAVQSHGTARLGRAFGPIILLWFVVLWLGGVGTVALVSFALRLWIAPK